MTAILAVCQVMANTCIYSEISVLIELHLSCA